MYSTSRIANCSKKLFVRLERCPSTHPSTIRPRSRLPWKPRDSLCRARICLPDCHRVFNISQKVENLISISRLKGCRSVNNSFILYNSFLASIRAVMLNLKLIEILISAFVIERCQRWSTRICFPPTCFVQTSVIIDKHIALGQIRGFYLSFPPASGQQMYFRMVIRMIGS